MANYDKDELAPIIFVMGGPGSGKGTQCKLIAEKYGYKHLSSGDLLREEAKFDKQLDATMKAGALVKTETVLNLIKAAMLKHCKSSKGFLIDGCPRDVAQRVQFEKEIRPPSLVLFFDTKDDTLVKRLLKRGRADDNEETITKRLATFAQSTIPVVKYYREHEMGKLAEIDAEGTIEDIFKEVCKHLDRQKGAEQ